ILDKQVELICAEIEKDFRKTSPENLVAHRRTATLFRRSHLNTWKKPIDLLEMFVYMHLEYHEKLYETYHKERQNNVRFSVLMALHGKALLTSFEILELIKGGLADGAMGRWRTLYETAIITCFLSKHDAGLAQQFLDYSAVQQYKDALEYQKNCSKLGYKSFRKREMDRFEQRRNAMVAKYGTKFKSEYGWLLNYLPEPHNFKSIEDNTSYKHFRSYYKMANHRVHSGPHTILTSLGSLNERFWLPAGPSNFGLADPGKNTAFALQWTSLVLAEDDNYIETSVFLKLTAKLAKEIAREFLETQQRIEEEETLLQKKQKAKTNKGRKAK
ncbi:MAG: DUF5677 domain-containing protein, partial [Chitinophagaceae bacterium]